MDYRKLFATPSVAPKYDFVEVLGFSKFTGIKKIPDFPINEVVCKTCKKKIKDFIDAEFTWNSGECLGCDHVRGDICKK